MGGGLKVQEDNSLSVTTAGGEPLTRNDKLIYPLYVRKESLPNADK